MFIYVVTSERRSKLCCAARDIAIAPGWDMFSCLVWRVEALNLNRTQLYAISRMALLRDLS